MRPTIANQQWKVHSQVKTKHFIWIFYLAASGGFAERLFRIWHDNREERALPHRALPSTYCEAGTGAHMGQMAVGSCVLFYGLIDLIDLPQLSKFLGINIDYFKYGRELENEHWIKSYAEVHLNYACSLIGQVTLGKSLHLQCSQL